MSQLIVIDSRLPDVQALVDAWTGLGQVLVLDASSDGLQQIADALNGRSGLDAIHLVAHGRPGALWLGTTTLDAAALQASSTLLAQIGASLGAQGDLLLYGPDLGAGATGASFVEGLASLTGADVVALTAATGGGWTQQAAVGSSATFALSPIDGWNLMPAPIDGSVGDDSIDGGDGDDLIRGLHGADTLAGGAGNDTLYGNEDTGGDPGDTFPDDMLSGGAGHDSLAGNDGADQLGGDVGDDTLDGGAGNDTLDGGDGFDIAVFRLDGSVGFDASGLGSMPTLADGQGGTDQLAGIEAVWALGSSADDTIVGSTHGDLLVGDDGSDALDGGDGNDTLLGGFSLYRAPGVGTDSPDGGNNTVLGGAGDDLLIVGRHAAGGTDTLDGGTGTDTLVLDYWGDAGNMSGPAPVSVQLAGQTADLSGSPAALDLGGSIGVLSVGGIERLSVTLTNQSDSFVSTGSDDTLRGGSGNDTLDGGAGDDVLDGGFGTDTLRFGSASGGVMIDVGAGTATGAAGDDRFSGFEIIAAGAHDDTLLGSVGIDLLYGGAGDDSIVGGLGADDLFGQDGDDSLSGGAGTDDLYGGAGDDTLVGGGHGLNEYDFAIYGDSGAGVVVNLAEGLAQGDAIGTDTLIEIDGAIGSNQADTLIGSAGDNYLRGRGGSDRIDGGAGYDIADYRDAGATSASLIAQSASYAVGTIAGLPWAAGTDTLAGIEGLSGSMAADTLTGDAGDNYLRGQRGDDLIDGGAGIDRAAYNQASGAVTVNLALGRASGADGNDTLVGIENLRGSAYGDTLTGDAQGNHIEAREGNDSVDGGAGEDTLVGGAGNDTLDGGTQPDNLPDAVGRIGRQFFDFADYSEAGGAVNVDLAAGTASGDGDDVLIGIEAVRGSTGNDTLTGNAADNLLRGNAGDDLLDGGAGNDVAEYGNAAGAVLVNLATGRASGAAGSDTLTSIEIAIGGAYDDTLIGSAGDNAIRGNAGDDSLDGGAGIDRVDYRTAGAGVVVDLDAGVAFGGDGNDLLAGFENVRGTDLYDDQLAGDAGANALEGRGGDDLLRGAAGNDTLAGDDGDDTLVGGLGNDQLQGGLGDDRYVLENRVAGTDTVTDGGGAADVLATRNDGFGVYTEFYRSGTSLVLEDYDELGNGALLSRTVVRNHAGSGRIEWLESTDAASGAVTRLSLAAGAAGGAGDDLVAGTTGNDTLAGADGADLLWAHLGNDSLDGGSGADALRGGAGADTLNGGSGADDLLGQAGNDVYRVDDAGDLVDERQGYGPNARADAGGIDTVQVSFTTAGARYTLGAYVENLVLQGTAAIHGSGNALANRITGNAAANTLDGAAGADTLTGGAGNDTYVVDDALDVVSETSTLAGEIDTVRSAVGWTLGANLERLVLTGSAAVGGTGNALANTITGNGAANLLSGGGGADTLAGGAGNDTLFGGVGHDSLTGGAGADVFRFAAAPDAATNLDHIVDFSSVDDTIQLENAVFTALGMTGTLSAASFRAGAAVRALDANDYLLYDTASGALWYDADGSGAGAAVQIAWLSGAPSVGVLDFVVT